VFDDAPHGRALLRWLKVPDAAYDAANGETRPALGDVDGDGRAEVIVGLGVGGGGRVAWFDDAQAGFASRGFAAIDFPAYDAAVGETRPACGDLDGDGRVEVVVGLAPFPSAGGNVAVLSLGVDGAWSRTWIRVPWQAYDAANGETWPSCGDVDGDGRSEIVLGMGTMPGMGGWACAIDDLLSAHRTIRWARVPWAAFDRLGGAVHPACGDWDGDGCDEVALALGPNPGAAGRAGLLGGWVALFDDAGQAMAPRGWTHMRWAAFQAAGGETWPAFAR